MSSRLIDCLATTDALADLFSDRSVLQAMLDFEVALARAAARAGAIPNHAADAIASAAHVDRLDALALVRDARQSGTPSIPLVRALTEQVRAIDPDSARYVHWGATSQDVTDSALALLLKRAQPFVAHDHMRLDRALRQLSDAHAGTVMLGRTLLQPATPITFGLKTAGWCAAVTRSRRRLSLAWTETLALQFGGATGTRAAAGEHARAIAGALAAQLGLANAPPWHTDRDRFGGFVAACGLYTAALGKVARDIALLMQAEIGEVAETGGGSSTMPHKRNPSGCVVAIAAATRMPGLVAAFLTGMLQEHERSVGGGQAEWPTVAAVVQSTGAASASLATVVESLSVDAARMRRNLEATNGVIFAERAVLLLAPAMGRDRAHSAVRTAVQRSRETGQRLATLLRALPDVVAAVSPADLEDIERPEHYLGDAEALRRELLAEPEA